VIDFHRCRALAQNGSRCRNKPSHHYMVLYPDFLHGYVSLCHVHRHGALQSPNRPQVDEDVPQELTKEEVLILQIMES